MTNASETASEYFTLAAKASDRGEVAEAIRYGDLAIQLLEREPAQIEPSGVLRGESFRFEHLGRVLAKKAELAQGLK